MYYVYLLENLQTKSWYLGFSADLRKRLADHNSGKGGKTTKSRDGWKLIYYEAYISKLDATGREKFLKSGSGHRFLKKQLRNYMG